MKLELDHLFICTTVGAPEVDELLAFGLTEGTRNNHPGQGTTNRRIFFQNAMLEFLWVDNEPADRRQPLEHACGFREITDLEMMIPNPEPLSPAVQFVHDTGLVKFRAGDEFRVDIEFDHGGQARSCDFRPHLPLCFHG